VEPCRAKAFCNLMPARVDLVFVCLTLGQALFGL
jgi:hypothetical protein